MEPRRGRRSGARCCIDVAARRHAARCHAARWGTLRSPAAWVKTPTRRSTHNPPVPGNARPSAAPAASSDRRAPRPVVAASGLLALARWMATLRDGQETPTLRPAGSTPAAAPRDASPAVHLGRTPQNSRRVVIRCSVRWCSSGSRDARRRGGRDERNSPDANSHAAVYSSKVASRHHERIAIVYVRQSTNYQLLHHQESTGMQYDLVDRAVALGWRRDRVLVIDADLGRSGASTEGRPGFKHMVAEVGLVTSGSCSASTCRGSRATAATGTSCSRCARSSARSSATWTGSTTRATTTTGCCSASRGR